VDEKQLSHLENRLNQLESRLKTIQTCLYILIGWVLVMSTSIGKSFYLLLGGLLEIGIILAVVALAFIWIVKWYQDWNLTKEKKSEG